MKKAKLREKLHEYIESAPKKRLKAIYTLVEDEIDEVYDYWEDETFLAELQRREKDYLNGTSKSYTLEETMASAREAIEKGKQKREEEEKAAD